MRQLRPLSLARRKETHLKYAVEVKIPRSTPMMGLLEPILERVVYEDIPFNLAALKQRVEDMKLQRRIAELEEQGVAPTAALGHHPKLLCQLSITPQIWHLLCCSCKVDPYLYASLWQKIHRIQWTQPIWLGTPPAWMYLLKIAAGSMCLDWDRWRDFLQWPLSVFLQAAKRSHFCSPSGQGKSDNWV